MYFSEYRNDISKQTTPGSALERPVGEDIEEENPGGDPKFVVQSSSVLPLPKVSYDWKEPSSKALMPPYLPKTGYSHEIFFQKTKLLYHHCLPQGTS